MKKLIFGCGYLGQRVALAWIREGHEVYALTRFEERAEKWSSVGMIPLVGDVTSPEELPTFPHAETVLYSIGFDRTTGHSMREVYLEGLKNVLTRLPDSVSRFIDISSTSVYAQQSGEWVDEDSPCEPIRENGKICLEAERCVEEFSRRDNSPSVTILRLAGLYGPGRLLRRIEELKSNQKITGNPDAFLNLIHVDDAAAAVLACEQNAISDRYLICDDRPITRREYYELLAQETGTELPQFAEEHKPDRTNLNKRCRNTKMKTELEFTLQFPTIAEGIPHAIHCVRF